MKSLATLTLAVIGALSVTCSGSGSSDATPAAPSSPFDVRTVGVPTPSLDAEQTVIAALDTSRRTAIATPDGRFNDARTRLGWIPLRPDPTGFALVPGRGYIGRYGDSTWIRQVFAVRSSEQSEPIVRTRSSEEVTLIQGPRAMLPAPPSFAPQRETIGAFEVDLWEDGTDTVAMFQTGAVSVGEPVFAMVIIYRERGSSLDEFIRTLIPSE